MIYYSTFIHLPSGSEWDAVWLCVCDWQYSLTNKNIMTSRVSCVNCFFHHFTWLSAAKG